MGKGQRSRVDTHIDEHTHTKIPKNMIWRAKNFQDSFLPELMFLEEQPF